MTEPDYRNTLYDGYADSFKNATGKFDTRAAEKWEPCLKYFLRNWLPKEKDSQIIDLGCGEGRLLYLLKRMGYTHVEGVDLSESQLNIARQISDKAIKADVLAHLRETSDSYDLILAFDLIEHLKKTEVLEFLDLCSKRLKTNGRLVLQTPNASSPFFGTIRYGDFTHELCFTPRILSQLSVRAGLSDIECRETGPVPTGYSFQSSIRYVLWQLIRAAFGLIETIETGGCGQRLYARVFLMSGIKKD